MSDKPASLKRELGSWHVAVAGIAVVVASTTLVSDFTGWLTLGLGFLFALAVAFAANLFLGLSVAELSTRFPRAGALYAFAGDGLSGSAGRFLGLFLALLLILTISVGASGELTAGSHGLNILLGEPGVRIAMVVLVITALLPNLIGLTGVAWVNAILLLGMLGIRWWFGIASFAGWTEPGTWEMSNIAVAFEPTHILSAGLGLAIWAFIGIEFVAPLAEEVKAPRRAMPRGIIIGLLVVLGTTVLMGMGTAGVLPQDAWAAAAFGEAGCNGDCVQLAVGQKLFGEPGSMLMAVASVTATYGSSSVGVAAMSRVLYSLARDNRLGPLSRPLSKLNRFSVPWVAVLTISGVFAAPAIITGEAVKVWIYTASYLWLILYAVYHLLVIAIRRNDDGSSGVFRSPGWLPFVGVGLVVVSLYFAFYGKHLMFGTRAAVLVGIVLVLTLILRAFERAREAG